MAGQEVEFLVEQVNFCSPCNGHDVPDASCGAFLQNGELNVHKVVHERNGPVDDQVPDHILMKTTLCEYDLKVIRKTELFSSAIRAGLHDFSKFDPEAQLLDSFTMNHDSPNGRCENLEVQSALLQSTKPSLSRKSLKNTPETLVTECFFNYSASNSEDQRHIAKTSLVFKEITKHHKYRTDEREHRALVTLSENIEMQKNLPNLIAIGKSEEHSLLILEKAQGIEFTEVVTRAEKSPLNHEILYQLMRAIVVYLERLQSLDYLHLDLKPKNIIVLYNKPFVDHAANASDEDILCRFDWSKPIELCVIDYGFSMSAKADEFHRPSEFIPCGTPEYMSPIMLNKAIAHVFIQQLKKAKLSGQPVNSAMPKCKPVESFFGACNEISLTKEQLEDYLNLDLDRSMDLPSAALTLFAAANGGSFFPRSADEIDQRVLERFHRETANGNSQGTSAFLLRLKELENDKSSHWRFPQWYVGILKILYTTGNFKLMRKLLKDGEIQTFGSNQASYGAQNSLPLLPTTSERTFGTITSNSHDF